ncbi:MAG: beta-ketoacyl-ACP synthase, partial [Verrucomicrobiota bacterium]
MATNWTERRVVITGMGAVTPIGNNVETFWQNLIAGQCGIGPITHFDVSAYDTKIAGEVKNFDPSGAFPSPKEIRR